MNLGLMELIIILWIVLAFGGATAILAHFKGRRRVLWFLLGAVFHMIALVIVVLLPKVDPPPDDAG